MIQRRWYNKSDGSICAMMTKLKKRANYYGETPIKYYILTSLKAAALAMVAVFSFDHIGYRGNSLNFLVDEPQVYTWNQKLTLEIETADQVLSGSSVVTITWRENDFKLNDPAWLPEIEGQAPYIELEDGRVIFALLGTVQFHDLAAKWLFGDDVTADPTEELLETASHFTEPLKINEQFFPTVVIFDDPSDPKSIRPVSDGQDQVYDSRFFVEVTDDQRSEISTSELLPWMVLTRDQLLAIGGGRNPVRFENGPVVTSVDDNMLYRMERKP